MILEISHKIKTSIFLWLFLIGIYCMQGWTATTRHKVNRRWSTKRLKHTGNSFRINPLQPSVAYL